MSQVFEFDCIDCGKHYVMPEEERARFEELSKNVENFFMPRRCAECRRNRRMAKNSGQPYVPPQQATPAVEVPAPLAEVPPPPVFVQSLKEPRIILVSGDFEELILGHPVVRNGIRIILAQVGFDVLRKAIDRAEVENAKAVLKKNGIAG